MVNKRILLFVALALAVPGYAQLGKIVEGLGKLNGPSDSRVASGLQEALAIGTEHAVDLTATTDGFFRNEAIKILLPEKMKLAEKSLRMAGMGAKVDDFELSMNRAAEAAAPAARNIFKDALLKMTFDDARKILTGGNTAATDYFKAKTSAQLTTAFRPSVATAMDNNGVVKQYKQLTGGLASMPFLRGQSLDITDYVVSKTMDGLFYMLSQEEKKIRTDPAAQITPLLKEVFGKR